MPLEQTNLCRCEEPWEIEPGECGQCGKLMKHGVGTQVGGRNIGLMLLDRAVEIERQRMRERAEKRGMTLLEYIAMRRRQMGDA